MLAMSLAAAFSITAFADGSVKTRENGLAEEQRRFPFEIVLSEDTCERKCFAGYGKKYQTGYGITPYTEFEVRTVDPAADAANLKIDIELIYKNDGANSSKTEKVRTYEYGDIAADGSYYSFFTERNIENLEEREKLYSDSQSSIRLTLTYNSGSKKTEKQYYQVCTEDDLMFYIENEDAEEMTETEAAPEVLYSESGEVVTVQE